MAAEPYVKKPDAAGAATGELIRAIENQMESCHVELTDVSGRRLQYSLN
jgi:hypothetical protein